MAKIFTYRGHPIEDLKKMSIEEFARLLTTRRRHLKRGLTEQEKKLLESVRKHPEKFHKTHLRNMIILPEMVSVKFGVYVGSDPKESSARWINVVVTPEVVGKRLGEFAHTVKWVKHSAPGIGATRESKFIATKT